MQIIHLIIIMKRRFFASLSATVFGPTSSKGQVLENMEEEQANINRWLALFCWQHKACVSDGHFRSHWNYGADCNIAAVQIR